MTQSEELSEIAGASIHTLAPSGNRVVEWPAGSTLPGVYATRDAALLALGVALAGRPETLRDAAGRSVRRGAIGIHPEDIAAALPRTPPGDATST